MKIAQVSPRYHPHIGGVETHVKEISVRLVKKDFDVEVITTDLSGELPKNDIINGVRVTRFKSLAYHDAFFFAPQIYDYLRRNEYDIIHAHNYHAFPALFATWAKKNGQKFVFTPHYHGSSYSPIRSFLHKPYRLLGSSIFKKADRVICVSKFEMELVKKHFNVPESKLVYIPNGIDFDEFRDVEKIQRRYKTILYVGRLEKYKGVQYVLQALPRLKEYRLEVVGSGPYEEKLKKMAIKLGVDDKIDWLSDLSRPELLKHYKSADIFVMPSEFEAYGITVAEALASGTPCIVAEAGALGEFVDGCMCKGVKIPISTDALIEHIHSFEGSKRVPSKALSSWNDIVEQLIQIYSE